MTKKHQLTDHEDAQSESEPEYQLRLFVTGASPNSIRAISNLKKICDNYLHDKYELAIIDVYQQPLIAEREQIIALPLLIRKSRGIERRLIGDMSDTEKVLWGLGIAPQK